jgi:hypothetical protein
MSSFESKIRQLQHETDTWKRIVEFITNENVVLKDRLSEILSGKEVTPEFLEKAEKYHACFTKEDEIVRLIRHDIRGLDKLIIKEEYPDGKMVDAKIISEHTKLSKAVENIINDFSKLKFEFNDYIRNVL